MIVLPHALWQAYSPSAARTYSLGMRPAVLADGAGGAGCAPRCWRWRCGSGVSGPPLRPRRPAAGSNSWPARSWSSRRARPARARLVAAGHRRRRPRDRSWTADPLLRRDRAAATGLVPHEPSLPARDRRRGGGGAATVVVGAVDAGDPDPARLPGVRVAREEHPVADVVAASFRAHRRAGPLPAGRAARRGGVGAARPVTVAVREVGAAVRGGGRGRLARRGLSGAVATVTLARRGGGLFFAVHPDGDPSTAGSGVFLLQRSACCLHVGQLSGGPLWLARGQVSALLPVSPAQQPAYVRSFQRGFPGRRSSSSTTGRAPPALPGLTAVGRRPGEPRAPHVGGDGSHRPAKAVDVPVDYSVWRVRHRPLTDSRPGTRPGQPPGAVRGGGRGLPSTAGGRPSRAQARWPAGSDG